MVKQRGPGVRATCPRGHRVHLGPIDSEMGLWLCPECGERHHLSQWKYKVWDTNRETHPKIPKEKPYYPGP